jgi:multimeric flavodoxin WrbA
MIILSASNVGPSGAASRSLELARRLAARLGGHCGGASDGGVEVADLRDYPIQSCDMCEACAGSDACAQPDRFNALKSRIDAHAVLAVVCPHYAGVPSQLMALLEKLQEMAYLAQCQGKPATPAKAFAVLAHGGMTGGYEAAYVASLIVPLANAARSLGWTVLNDAIPEPLVLGVARYHERKDPGSVCPAKDDDEVRADHLVDVLAEALAKTGPRP